MLQIVDLLQKNYARIVLLLVVMVASGLIWLAQSRLADYRYHELQVATESVAAVAPHVSAFIEEKGRLVSVFANEHIEILRSIVNHPADEAVRTLLQKKLLLYFPQSFTFTVANADGVPYYEDFDGFIGELCKADLHTFAESGHYAPYIHPISEGYHFDVMTRFELDGQVHILFVSFLAKMLGDLLATAETTDHTLMLIYPERHNLIEVVASGARDTLHQLSFQMSENEIKRIIVKSPVASTRWQVADLRNPGVLESFRNRLSIESLTIFILFTTIGFALVYRLWKEDLARQLAQNKHRMSETQKSAMVSVIAHEFRTPVTAIAGSLRLLSPDVMGKELNENARQLVEMAARNTVRLQALVDDFLDLQRLESNSLRLDLACVELTHIVRESVRINTMYARQFNVEVKIQPLPDEVYIEADSNRIEQVLTNLLSNAVKYGGSDKQVVIQVVKLDGHCRVEVTDTGPGIPAAFHSQVFETFSMAGPKLNSQHIQSSGLGLSIAKSIIEKHGGKIGFITKEGVGTTFYFELATISGLRKV